MPLTPEDHGDDLSEQEALVLLAHSSDNGSLTRVSHAETCRPLGCK